MRIERGSQIAGLRAIRVRDALRRLSSWSAFSVNSLARALKISGEKARSALEHLVASGYVEDARRPLESGRLYSVTRAGMQFALATAGASLSRALAARRIAEFLKRVESVNANDDYVSRIAKVFVFGSYLSEAAKLNDIDIAIQMQHRYSEEAYTRKADERIEIAEARGRRFANILDRLGWPETEIKLFLKARTRGISLHEADELERLGCPFKEVFPKNELASDPDLAAAMEKSGEN